MQRPFNLLVPSLPFRLFVFSLVVDSIAPPAPLEPFTGVTKTPRVTEAAAGVRATTAPRCPVRRAFLLLLLLLLLLLPPIPNKINRP